MLHTVIGSGSAALVPAVSFLPRYGDPNFPRGTMKYQQHHTHKKGAGGERWGGWGHCNIEMHKRSNFSRLDAIGRPWRLGGGGGARKGHQTPSTNHPFLITVIDKPLFRQRRPLTLTIQCLPKHNVHLLGTCQPFLWCCLCLGDFVTQTGHVPLCHLLSAVSGTRRERIPGGLGRGSGEDGWWGEGGGCREEG